MLPHHVPYRYISLLRSCVHSSVSRRLPLFDLSHLISSPFLPPPSDWNVFLPQHVPNIPPPLVSRLSLGPWTFCNPSRATMYTTTVPLHILCSLRCCCNSCLCRKYSIPCCILQSNLEARCESVRVRCHGIPPEE